ncbi:MAG: hypothetical protein RLZZ622_195, partial [Planctomycetota bacterium]
MVHHASCKILRKGDTISLRGMLVSARSRNEKCHKAAMRE